MALAGVFMVAAPQAAVAVPADVRQKVAAADAPVAQLEQVSVKRSLGVRFHHFRQEVGGVPVLGSEVVVTDAPGAGGDMSVDSTANKVDRPPRPTITESQAIAAAIPSGGGAPLRAPATASLAIDPTSGGGRLVWQVDLPAGFTTFEVLVDARSGEVVRSRDLARNATARAQIFDPNPVKAQGSFEGLRGPEADHDDADTPQLTSLRTPETLRRLGESGCLTGRWVHAFIPLVEPMDGVAAQDDEGNYDPAGSGQGRQEVCSENGDFTAVTRSDNAFEALMAYFHIDRAQRYIQSLGFSRAKGNGIVDRRIQVYVDYIGDDNSYYASGVDDNPSTAGRRHIVMGIGGVDDAEDADVLVHEYTHAMQDAQSHSFLVSGSEDAGSIAEGGGDYFASSVNTRFAPSDGSVNSGCWSAWDVQKSSRDTRCLRRVHLNATLPRIRAMCDGSFHCAGQAWSGALWEIRGKLGATRTDRTLLQSQFSYGAGTGFKQAARAFLRANRRLARGRNTRAITRVFCRRKLLRGRDCRLNSSGRAPGFAGKD